MKHKLCYTCIYTCNVNMCLNGELTICGNSSNRNIFVIPIQCWVNRRTINLHCVGSCVGSARHLIWLVTCLVSVSISQLQWHERDVVPIKQTRGCTDTHVHVMFTLYVTHTPFPHNLPHNHTPTTCVEYLPDCIVDSKQFLQTGGCSGRRGRPYLPCFSLPLARHWAQQDTTRVVPEAVWQ